MGYVPPPAANAPAVPPPRRSGLFSLSRRHSATSATLLLSLSSLASGLLGLVRTKYIAHTFRVGHVTDAYNAAFQLPDMISYFLVGGVASITLVNILNRLREVGDDDEADRALSVVLVAMVVVLAAAVLLAEFLAPLYTRTFFGSFDPETAALCTHLTRLLLPAQLFFFAGGALGSRLLVRKIFLYQAVTPLLYNLFIILGGLLLASRFGIDSLAYGVLAGAFLGSFALNALGAARSGLRFTPILHRRHPAFLEWLRLSIPLMLGVSLAMADKWILAHYAAADRGGITLLTNAKILFNAPLTVIGAAAGAASLPFFSSLYAKSRLADFNAVVCRSVSRLLAAGFLLTAWMFACATPIVAFLRGGAYTQANALATARYFALFALSLALWSAQGIYARAFYAARNTLTPAISGTVVTLVSIPVYALLFHRIGLGGLALASDLGILAHTVTLALLLHRARLARHPRLPGTRPRPRRRHSRLRRNHPHPGSAPAPHRPPRRSAHPRRSHARLGSSHLLGPRPHPLTAPESTPHAPRLLTPVPTRPWHETLPQVSGTIPEASRTSDCYPRSLRLSATTTLHSEHNLQRRWARVAGLMFWVVLVVDIAGTQLHSSLGRSLALTGSLCTVPLALGLFYSLRPVQTVLAASALSFRLVEAALGLTSTLAGYAGLRASLQKTTFGAALLRLAAWNDATMFAAFVFTLGSSVFFYLFVKSGYIPRALAWLGLVASVLAFAACLTHLFRPAFPAMTMYAWTPMLLAETSTGLWLLLRPLRIAR